MSMVKKDLDIDWDNFFSSDKDVNDNFASFHTMLNNSIAHHCVENNIKISNKKL